MNIVRFCLMILFCFLLSFCCSPDLLFHIMIAWWQYQLKEQLSSLDVCYHPPQTAIFLHSCQPCCLWSCTEHWIGEAIQVKNNPTSGCGWQEPQPPDVVCCHKSVRAVCNRRKSWQPSLRDTCLLQEIWIFQPVEGALWVRMQESFACVLKGWESKPHCAQMPAQNIFTQGLV